MGVLCLIYSKLFEPQPQTWGFSGDIYFWNYLKEHFETKTGVDGKSSKNIETEADLRADIDEVFSYVSNGHKLADGGLVACPSISVKGEEPKRTVTVNAAWWTHTGIPMLCKRFRREKLREHYRKNAEEGVEYI